MNKTNTTKSTATTFFLKHKKLVIALSATILIGAIAIITVFALLNGNDGNDGLPTHNPITGERDSVVYYYEVPSGEVLLTLKRGWRFTLAGPDINKSGEYTLKNGTELTFDFVREEDADATGALGQNKISLTMNGATMTFKEKTNFTVTFNTNGGSAVEAQLIMNGKTAAQPTSPTKDGYSFDGWYQDAALTKPFDFSTNLITKNTVIYAKWS